MKKIEFEIKNIDPLGQGVSKKEEQIPPVCFIAKTLPGEKGVAYLSKQNKKIGFGLPVRIENPSPKRVEPSCLHYSQCSGCHYLHTDYQTELEFKETSFKFLFKNLTGDFKFFTHKAPTRDHYRNRIQLHYDKTQGLLGFTNRKQEIFLAPNCIIAKDEVLSKMKDLYENWEKLVHSEKKKGHIELYLPPAENQVKISVNQMYSSGGFSQVNEQMNKKLQEFVQGEIDQSNSKGIIDLFGGSGNLTSSADVQTFVVDVTPGITIKTKHQTYGQINLYERNAIQNICEQIDPKDFDLLIIDPPRSGLKNIDEFTERLNPKKIIYVSCMPQTLARDLKIIEESFEILSLHLFDLFPSTYHFESVAILERK